MDGPGGPYVVPISPEAAFRARVHYGVTVPLMALVLAALCGRLYLRLWPTYRMWVDDWFIVAGFALTVVDWSLLVTQVMPTPRWITLEHMSRGIRLAYFAIPLWGLSMTVIKTGISLMILRVRHTLPWKIFLFTLIGMQAAYAIGNVFFSLFGYCKPLAATWDVSYPRENCDRQAMRIASFVGAATNITTDLLLSLAPIVFVIKLQRPLRERVMICFLMGLGMLASVASIVKSVRVNTFAVNPLEDHWASAISISTWTVVEQLLGVLAACVPCLKRPIQRFLDKIGFSITASRWYSYSQRGPNSSYAAARVSRYIREREAANDPNSITSFTDLDPKPQDAETVEMETTSPAVDYASEPMTGRPNTENTNRL